MASNCPTEVSRSMHFCLLALALFPHLLRGELVLVIGNFYASNLPYFRKKSQILTGIRVIVRRSLEHTTAENVH